MKNQSKRSWIVSAASAAVMALAASGVSAEESRDSESLTLYCPGQEIYLECFDNITDCNNATVDNGIEDGCQYGTFIGGNVCEQGLDFVRYMCP